MLLFGVGLLGLGK
ncbi:hypothetical protein CSA56_12680 [candidate division KSB3 bacterium]|uniref:Uncharacterized protein n=1 Tax=candidate division KSB3 bacterium TaxID=2044937 RepID=A0A2G6KC29_9BACT|nr:MAG: hypothetical protein CSA56_12680 [candidate division KSB3 bacterium]